MFGKIAIFLPGNYQGYVRLFSVNFVLHEILNLILSYYILNCYFLTLSVNYLCQFYFHLQNIYIIIISLHKYRCVKTYTMIKKYEVRVYTALRVPQYDILSAVSLVHIMTRLFPAVCANLKFAISD